MSQTVKWKYDFKRFDAIRAQVQTAIERETARGAGNAKTLAAAAAPSHTGALAASLHVVTPASFQAYDDAIRAAQGLNPRLGAQILGSLFLPPVQRGQAQAALDCPLDYGAVVENGAFNPLTGAYIAAHPFFAPAVQQAFPDFARDLERALASL